MSDFGDAMGTAVEGGLYARAVTGDAGEPRRADGHFAEGACLNCGSPLTGPHCHQCGQKAHLHRTLGAFMHDLLHGALHFEGKIWHTLPKLALRPGELTRRYIAGERVRFVSPMALFLFSIFLMFAVFQMVGLTAPTDLFTDASVAKTFTQVEDQMIEERDSLREDLQAMPADAAGREELAQRVAKAEEDLTQFRALREGGVGHVGTSVTEMKTGFHFLDKMGEKWNANPGLMLYKLQSNSYKFSWLLIPLSIPFVWLLFFWKRRFNAYDHAIFVTYSLSFMSLLFVAISLFHIVGIPAGVLGAVATIIPPIHIYKQLRGGYELSRFSALWRTAALIGVIVFIVLTLFLQILLVLGAF